jgi:hypothetical protein
MNAHSRITASRLRFACAARISGRASALWLASTYHLHRKDSFIYKACACACAYDSKRLNTPPQRPLAVSLRSSLRSRPRSTRIPLAAALGLVPEASMHGVHGRGRWIGAGLRGYCRAAHVARVHRQLPAARSSRVDGGEKEAWRGPSHSSAEVTSAKYSTNYLFNKQFTYSNDSFPILLPMLPKFRATR